MSMSHSYASTHAAVTALVFAGDPVEAATRSAVWGASAGAATGAIDGRPRVCAA